MLKRRKDELDTTNIEDRGLAFFLRVLLVSYFFFNNTNKKSIKVVHRVDWYLCIVLPQSVDPVVVAATPKNLV